MASGSSDDEEDDHHVNDDVERQAVVQRVRDDRRCPELVRRPAPRPVGAAKFGE